MSSGNRPEAAVSDPRQPVLSLQNIRKKFGTLEAVRGLSLQVAAGEVFGLLGPNGAGKSTSIAISTGLVDPDQGEVNLLGMGSPRQPDVRRHLGLAPQEITLYETLTAQENLVFQGELYGLADPKGRAAELLGFVELDSRAKDVVGNFSGGMKRRLNLAAALVHDPTLVLLDEATAGVDPQSRNRIMELVRQLAGQGKAVVWTTHYMEEAAKICDRVGIIDHGQMLACGTVSELIARHGGETAVAVDRDGVEERVLTHYPVAEVTRLLAGKSVTGIRVERPDLETVFLGLTGRSLRE